MPYDPVTGEWKPDDPNANGLLNPQQPPAAPAAPAADTSVSDRVTGLIAKDSPFMQSAATRGQQAVNSRGLLNSSMGVQAVEAARIEAALPIASQEAGQQHQRGLLETDIASRESLQAADIEGQGTRLDTAIAAESERLGRQLTSSERIAMEDRVSREGMQGVDVGAQQQRLETAITAEAERLGRQLTSTERVALEERLSRESMQSTDIAAQQQRLETDVAAASERLGRQLTSAERIAMESLLSRERLQTADISAMQGRLEQELGSRAELQEGLLAAQKERLGEELSSRERIALENLRSAEARLDTQLESTERIAQQDQELRERIAGMNLSANERNAAATLIAGFEATYSQTIAGIYANTEIPAAERQRYLDHAAATRDSNLNLVEQMFGIELDWGTGAGGDTAPNYDPGAGPRYLR